ncbi:DUF6440 family protein [Paenibacillus polymyxa]|uniref:DUF6440 domain-containing protein n=1 Tax=Paenibacillus polymyxa (strain SC2) TaxID=886882 RepID=E3ELE6_PAEPS|nr:DUF6440 family protein [Paenibacillus polymyxa]ADO59978.1 hypothetical protein PPSC2_28290 [Paenibacillus polymyxa SC2]WPQ59804.1 DUF6440 family protein [Paenibacillus polymyxa]
MKKLFGIIAILFVVVMSGCTTNQNQTQSIAENMPNGYSDRFIESEVYKHKVGDKYNYQYVITDKKTNVQYLVLSTARRNSDGGIAITPIINGDGKPYMTLHMDKE